MQSGYYESEMEFANQTTENANKNLELDQPHRQLSLAKFNAVRRKLTTDVNCEADVKNLDSRCKEWEYHAH